MIIAFKHHLANPNLASAAVRWHEDYPYTHTELIFDRLGWVCFSSRVTDNGVYVKNYNESVSNPTHWLAYVLPVAAETEQACFDAAAREVSKPFNFTAVLGHLWLGKEIDNSNRRFCSQVDYEILNNHAGLDLPQLKSYDVTPRVLHQMVLAKGYFPIPLP